MTSRRKLLAMMAGLPVLALVGCSGEGEAVAQNCQPLLLTDEHDCALCGMTIIRFPGPKAQACLRDGRILPFCSVHDMLAWSWQPESRVAIQSLWVHDLSRTGWDEPDHDAWMPAEDAVYVVGHDQRGAMGHSPAPFSAQADARTFIEHHGGQLMALGDMNFDNFRGGQDASGGMMNHHHHG